ncbi:MAG TPA: TonB-dependent receptor [Flavipsychrobacter sp.]|nr:TonB-dependent receptor [Flavipsychrobacter sp.]
MNTLRLVILLSCLFYSSISLAQKKVTISGYMRDAQSGEALIAATVYVKELEIGVQTNNYGFYSVTVPQGSYSIIYSYVGYGTKTETMQLIESRVYNAEMINKTALAEVEILATSRKDENVKTTEMGTVSMSVDQIKTLPVIFGEVDILKALQLMPGVQSAGEGNSGFYVRGGGPDQNLVLLDDAVVYNPGHLFGFFSVFNSDAVKNITLIKGSMPASYGGRLSSVVDVSMKEGNVKEYRAQGGIGLIASRLTIEGPLEKHKGSFVLSGRRTYIDVLMQPFTKNGNFGGSGYFFYDANLKANFAFSKRDRLYLSGYFGRDKFTFNSQTSTFRAEIPWGNSTATLRYNHLFSDRLFMNVSAIYNEYQFEFGGSQSDFELKLASGIKDWNGKVDFDYYAANNHHFKAGINYIYHKFIPNQISGRTGDTELKPDNALIKYAHEAAVYVQDDFELFDWLQINAGLRYSYFGQAGPYVRYSYDINQSKTDSTSYSGGQIVKSYGGLEPRLNMRFSVSPTSSIKSSIVKSYQYIHLITNNGTTLPTDLWVPSTFVVQPQEAWQYSLGYFRNFLDNKVETSVELYYKSMKNQIEYRQGYTPNALSADPELEYVFGNGEAYGAEFLINKTKGKFTGWIGYTLSWTWRKFKDLNNGERYPAKYDRRHDLSVVGTYVHSKRWTFSGVFIFGSGSAITLPTNYYFIEQQLTPEYSKLNEYRLFPYHRLDLSAIYTPTPKKPKRWKSSWAFSIYNVYSRQNPYFLYVDSRGNTGQGVDVKVKQVSIFPILPSITYNFSF